MKRIFKIMTCAALLLCTTFAACENSVGNGNDGESGGSSITYTVTIAVNEPEYGAVSVSIVENVAKDSLIRINGNELTIGDAKVVATAATETEQYSYEFLDWSAAEKVTGNIKVTANFSRAKKLFEVTFIVDGEETSVKDEYNVLNPTRGFWKKHTPEKFVWRYGKDFSYVEAKSWCALQLIVGSSLFLGDRLIKLNEKGLKLIKTTLAYADFESGYPEKLFDSPVSSVWRKEKAVAVFNFDDVEKTFCVDRLTAKKYKDAFTEQSFFTENNLLRVTLLPHDCVYLTESYV